MVGAFPEKVALVRLAQDWNAHAPILETLNGKSILVRLLHP